MARHTKLGPGGYPIASGISNAALATVLHNDSDSFHQPTVVSTTTLAVSLHDDADSFYAPTVAPGSVSLVASLVASDDAFHQPTVSPGSVSLVASLHDDTDTFYAPTTVDTVTLAAALHDDADAFYAPVATPGAVTLLPSALDHDDAVYEPVITKFGEATPGHVASDDAFYAPTATPGAVTLVASLVTDADAFHAPTAATITPLAASLAVDADTFYSPALTSSITLAASLAVDADAIFGTVVTYPVSLQPSFVDSDVVIHTPTDASIYNVFVGLVSDADSIFAPAITTAAAPDVAPSRYVDADALFTPAVQRQSVHGGGGGPGGGGTVTSDLKYATKITMDASGLISALQMVSTSAKTVNTRMMVYADSAGVPGALLGQTSTKSSIVVGTNTYTMLVPVSVLVAQVVWVALHTDGNVNWFLVNSPGGSRYNTDLFSDGPSNPFATSSIDNKKAPVLVVLLEAVNASVLPPLYSDAESFYAPVVDKTYSMVASYMQDTDFFYAPLARGDTPLLPDAVASDDSVHAATASPGAATLLPSLIASDDDVALIIGVSVSPTQKFPSHIVDVDSFGETTVTPEGARLPPGLVSDGDAVHVPSVVSSYPLVPSLVPSDDVVGTTVAAPGAVGTQPQLVVDVDQHWISILVRGVGDSPLLSQSVVDGDVFYSPLLGNPRRSHRVALRGSSRRPSLSAVSNNDATIEGDASHTELELEGSDA